MAILGNQSTKTEFKFNLIPPPSKEEIVTQNTKTKSFLYTVILVIGAVLAYLALNIFNIAFVESRINNLEERSTALDLQIRSKDEVKRTHGELITKANLLEPVLELDIKLTQFFDVVGEIDEDSEVRSYNRESDGRFIIVLEPESVSVANQIVKNAKEHEEIQDVLITTFNLEEVEVGDDNFVFTISFKLIA